MAFLPFSYDDGQPRPWEYLPCSAITPKVGMALTQSSGNLAIATGTTKPTYIAMADYSAALTSGTVIPVIRVVADQIYETTNSASLSGVNIGQKVTIHSDGMQVTATTSSGVAEIVAKDADAVGSRVLVRIP